MRVEKHAETHTTLFRFEDCADYANALEATPSRDRGDWAGENWNDSIKHARQGDVSLVPEAEMLMEKIHVDAAREHVSWMPSRGGAYVIVPEAIIGYPEPMRRRLVVEDDRGPIRVYVDLTSSAAVSGSDMRKRGTAILALVMLLNMERAVELNVAIGLNSGSGAGLIIVPLGSTPLDIALSCNALTSVGFVRRLGYQFLSHSEACCEGGWAWNCGPFDDAARKRYVEKLREAVGASEKDIIVPPSFVHDEIIRDPLAFVKRSLEEAMRVESEAA